MSKETSISFDIEPARENNSFVKINQASFLNKCNGKFPMHLLAALSVVPMTPDEAKLVEITTGKPLGLIKIYPNGGLVFSYGVTETSVFTQDQFMAHILTAWLTLYKANLTTEVDKATTLGNLKHSNCRISTRQPFQKR